MTTPNRSPDPRLDEMVRRQIEARGVRCAATLRAMRAVPRDRFVPARLRAFAFDDRALRLGHGQTISQPYMVAAMTAALELRPGDRVLEVGTGSGYAAAVLAEVGADVDTIERDAELAEAARRSLAELGYPGVRVWTGDGTRGLPQRAPFDAIVVTAGGPAVPEALREQLAVGGRLVVPVGPTQRQQQLVRVRRVGAQRWDDEVLFTVRFVPLLGEQGWDSVHRRPQP